MWQRKLAIGFIVGNFLGIAVVPGIISAKVGDADLVDQTGPVIIAPEVQADDSAQVAKSEDQVPTDDQDLSADQSATENLQLSELLPDPASPLTDAMDEYIEIQNVSSLPVDAAGYQLVIGKQRYELSEGIVAPGGFVLVKSADSKLTLANDGGSLALFLPQADATSSPLDNVTWPKVAPNVSWNRDATGWYSTTVLTPGRPNAARTVSSPSLTDGALSPVMSGTNPEVTAPGTTQPTASVSAPTAVMELAPPLLTELLPDPEAPLTDAADEFIELYNPNNVPLPLNGYSLRTGSKLTDHFAFTNEVIPAGGYLAVTSGVSKLGLANAGSTVAVFNAASVQVGQAISYDSSAPGQSLAFFGSTWSWTTTPTPGQQNILSTSSTMGTTPVLAVSGSAISAAGITAATLLKSTVKQATTTTASKTSVKAAATPKPSKTPKPTKSPSPTKTPKAKTAALKPLVAGTSTSGGHWLLFTLIGLTMAYIIYEFRHDLLSIYKRSRSNAAAGSQGSPVIGTGGRSGATERPRGRQDDLRSGSLGRPLVQW